MDTTKPDQINYFVNKRRKDKEALLNHLNKFIGSVDDDKTIIGIDRAIGIFSLRTGLSIRVLKIYLEELQMSGRLSIE